MNGDGRVCDREAVGSHGQRKGLDRRFSFGGLFAALVALSPGAVLIGCLADEPEPLESHPLETLELSWDDGFEWAAHGADSVGQVTATATWRDGLVVADRTASNVRGFDKTGEILFTVGGSGEGPGEFVTLTNIGTHGDRLWAFDRSLRRVTYWNLEHDGPPRLVDTEEVPGSMEVAGVLQRGVWGRFRPGECLVFGDEPFETCDSGVADGGREVVLLRARPGFGGIINLGNRETVGFQPFATDPVMVGEAEGDGVVVLHRVPPDTAAGATRIVRVGLDGEVLEERSIVWPTSALTDAMVSRAVRTGLPTMSTRIQALPNVSCLAGSGCLK